MKFIFNVLPKEVQEIITYKAQECEVSVEKYLEYADKNYVIISNNKPLPWSIVNNDDYVVYHYYKDAMDDTKDGEQVATEDTAIQYLIDKYSK